MMSSAFRIGALLSIFIAIGQIAPSSGDKEMFVTKAVNFCVTKTFLKSFVKFTLPSDSDVAMGSQLYSKIENGDFQETGVSGTIIELPMDKIKELVDLWNTQGLINSEEVSNIGNILSSKFFKTFLEHVFVRDNGEIVYGTTGFVEAKKPGKNRVASVVYSFRKFKIPTPAVVVYERADSASGTCTLWGQFCPTIFKVDGFSDSESQELFSYMRSVALKHFMEDNNNYIDHMEKETKRYEPFLPQTYKDSLIKMESNPDKLPSEIFSEDPFTIGDV